MIFVLLLNDMRNAHAENVEPVARASTSDALMRYEASERVDPYIEPGENSYGTTTFGKCHRKGGPLEWFNPLEVSGEIGRFPERAEYMEQAGKRWDENVGSIPEVTP
jgi:hypothetical protein